MTGGRDTYVFAYGSLAALGGAVRRLGGVRRVLGVAMDNRIDEPGYKYFVAPDGSRPAVRVAFLDLAPARAADEAVNGVCVPAGDLAALDARERQYERVDITPRLDDPPGRVWAYVGSAAGRSRRAVAPVVVAAAYLRLVDAAFAALGPAEHAAFQRSSELDGLPVRELERIDLPTAGRAERPA